MTCDISNYRIRISLQYIFALPALGFYCYQYLKIKDFFAKTLNDVRLDMGGKVYTATESPILNRCDTIGNIYAGERFAIAKSTLSNRCDTIWDIYAGERVAMAKSTLSNRCDTIWNIYVSEGFATAKSTLSNCCDTIWDCIVCFFCSVCNKNSFIFVE